MASPAIEMPIRESPFRGLGYYDEEDTDWFFGREAERKTIIANLRAARLTLLYAESGVGKSSLLRAGVAARLRGIARQSGERGARKFIPVVFSSWQDEPVEDLIRAIEREANAFAVNSGAVELPTGNLVAAIDAAHHAVDATFLIILDQFEEYFGYRTAREDPDRLADDLAESILEPPLRANFLIAIREDSYARLGDLFAGRKINVYGNYLHLEYLDRAAGRAAIEGPIERFNATRPERERMELEPALTQAVLDEVRRGRLVLGQGAQDGVAKPGQSSLLTDEIETPFLQLVMTRLWELESKEGSRVVRKATLDRLGGAETIVRTHLDAALGGFSSEELEAATDIFHDLVTPSGAKIAHTASDLEKMTARQPNTIATVLAKLDAARVIRPVEPAPRGREQRYEIFHDRLAAPLLDWTALRDNERLRREARAQRRRGNTFRALAIGSALLLVLAVGLAIWALRQRDAAHRAADAATSLALASDAQAQLPTRLDNSLRLALAAYAISPRPEARSALIAALEAARTQRIRGIFARRTGSQTGVAFSPDSRTLAFGDGTMIRFLDLQTGTESVVLRTGQAGDVANIAFSPDGRTIASTSNGGKTIWLWDVRTHTRLGSALTGHTGNINDIAISADGRTLASAGDDAVRLWDLRTQTEVGAPLNGSSDSVAFSPDGHILVSGDADGTMRLVDARTGRQLGSPLTPRLRTGSETFFVAFSRDGHTVASVQSDGPVEFWDVRTRKPVGSPAPDKGAMALAFSPDGQTLASLNFSTIHLWSARTHKQATAPLVANTILFSEAFSPDGRTLAAVGSDGTIRVWDLGANNYLGAEAKGQVLSIAFSPDGRTLASAGADGAIRLWNVATHSQSGSIPHHPVLPSIGRRGNKINEIPGTVTLGIAVSPDGRTLAAAGADGKLRLWNLATQMQLGTPLAVNPNSLAFSPNSRTLAFVSGKTIRLWNIRARRQVGSPLTGSTGDVNGIAFSPDGRILASVDDNAIRLWDIGAHKPLGPPLNFHTHYLSTVAFSPDGDTLAFSDGDDGTVRLLDVRTHRQLGSALPAGAGNPIVRAVAFTPDGKTLATADDDGQVRLWDVASHTQLGPALAGGNGGLPPALAISPDGRSLAAAGDYPIRLWDGILWRNSDDLRNDVCGLVVTGLSRNEWAQYAPGIPYRATCGTT
jgi:WD40 repeat protein